MERVTSARQIKFKIRIQRCLVKMFRVNVCPVSQSFSFGRVMPPLQQKSRVLHVVTDNKQRTTLKARRNLWHFQTQTKNRDIHSLGKLKGSAEAAGRHSLDAVNMMDRSTVRWGTGINGVEIYPNLPGWLGVAIHPIRPYQYLPTRLRVLDWVDPDDGDARIFRNVGNSLPVDTASHVSPATPIWEPHISYRAAVFGFRYFGHVTCHSLYRVPRVKHCLNIEQGISYLTQHIIWLIVVITCCKFPFALSSIGHVPRKVHNSVARDFVGDMFCAS